MAAAKMKKPEADPLAGCCGLYCGLCNKFQSKAPSRCVGCGQGEQHAWCSVWNCCVKKHQLENCAECGEVFQCPVFLRRKVAEWIPASDNLREIQRAGLDSWLKGQKKRQTLLEEMLSSYNEGRSMSLYCKFCARVPVDLIRKAVRESGDRLKNSKFSNADIKSKAAVMKASIHDLVSALNIGLY
jgi:hypothetical protein